MAEQKQPEKGQPTPSQAEGEETPGTQPTPKTTPSQAEGDLETVEDDLRAQAQK
ncbi:MAG TPA: hypothetical protein VNA16_06995 [Abditibacteriaceae bacterium]|nr:hypothetical protein [Abditibacteriaceae bacterium]